MQKSGNGRKAKAHSPIHIDFTGCKKLLLSVKPVASDWVYSLRMQQANFIVMPQHSHAHMGQLGKFANFQHLVFLRQISVPVFLSSFVS